MLFITNLLQTTSCWSLLELILCKTRLHKTLIGSYIKLKTQLYHKPVWDCDQVFTYVCVCLNNTNWKSSSYLKQPLIYNFHLFNKEPLITSCLIAYELAKDKQASRKPATLLHQPKSWQPQVGFIVAKASLPHRLRCGNVCKPLPVAPHTYLMYKHWNKVILEVKSIEMSLPR